MLSLNLQKTHTKKKNTVKVYFSDETAAIIDHNFVRNQYMGKGLTSKVNSSNDYFWCGKVKGLYRELCLFLTEMCFL